jgi:ABC-2 type transport system permease protein
MNIINKGFLKLALSPASFYRSIGVDTAKLKAIVTTKLIMDDRRPNSIQQTRRKKEKQVSLATVGTMVMSALIGLLYLLVFSIGTEIVTQLTFYFTLFFFMLSLTLISDFTSVLIDVRDNYIILPKPVNDRTFVVARLLHIFIHLCKIVLPMSIAGLCFMAINYSIYGCVLFLLLILFNTAISIFFINALYILILKFTTPQRFQSIISYVQIFFAIFMYGSYQFFPRMINQLNLDDFDISSVNGIAAFPIYWLANSWQVLYTFGGNAVQIGLAVAGLLLPFISIFVVVRYMAPSFNRKLALLNNSSSTPEKTVGKKGTQKGSYAQFLSKVFTYNNAEKAGFLFTWKMTSRSRDFKVKVYPSMGYMIVYVVVFFMNSRNMSLADLHDESSNARLMILGALYFTSFLLMMAIGQIVYSEKFKASWIYYTSPVEKPGEIILGAAKAAILKFYIPIVVIITVAGVVLIGPKVLPNIILGLFNEVLIAAVLVYAGNKIFPFSLQQNNNVKAGSFLRTLFVLFISGLIGFGHYLIYSILPAVAICAVLSIIASWLLLDSIKKISWQKIKSSYAEE